MKSLPHSLDAERAVIGALLLWPQGIKQIDGLLNIDEFYHPQHRIIFQTALELYRTNNPVDAITIHERLNNRSGINLEILSNFADAISTLENIEYHCSIVREKAILRNLIITCQDIAMFAYDPELSAEETITMAMEKIEKCYHSQPLTINASQLTTEFFKACEFRFRNPEQAQPLGVPTGFHQFDEFLTQGGIPRGHVTIIAAETSKGKSALAQAIMRNAVMMKYNVLDITLEDKARARNIRHMAAISRIKNRQLQQETIAQNEWAILFKTTNKILQFGDRLHYIDHRFNNVNELLAYARRHAQKHKTDLVVIDYLQLVPSGQPFRRRQDHVDYVFERIEQFAGDHPETATILVSQMARHEGRPKLRHLYHSAKLEQGAHTVLLIWAPEMKTRMPCRAVDVAKQKDGPTGIRVLGWEGRCVRFFNASVEDIKQYLKIINKIK